MSQRLRSWPSRVTGHTVPAHIQEIPALRTGNVVLLLILVARYLQITVAAAQHPVSKTVNRHIQLRAQIAYYFYDDILFVCLLIIVLQACQFDY